MKPSNRKLTTLAVEIAKAACKLFVPDVADRIATLSDLAHAIFGDTKLWEERNSFERQLEDAVDALTVRLERWEQNEFPTLAATERKIAIEVVTEVLTGCSLQREYLVNDLLLDSERIFAFLEPKAAIGFSKERLSQYTTNYGRLLLNEACHCLVGVIRGLPDFHVNVSWANYVLTHQLVNDVKTSLDNMVMPRYRRGEPREVTRFEAAYAEDFVSTFSTVELFGINIPDELRQLPIEIAYITLSASPGQFELPTNQGLDPGQRGAPDSSVDALRQLVEDARRAPVDIQLGIVLRFNEILARAELSADEKRERFRKELHELQGEKERRAAGQNPQDNAIKRLSTEKTSSSRILIVGGAGSGKTTIVQWLALQAALHRLPSSLVALNGCLPFYVPLRDIFRAGKLFPTDEDLVRAIASHRIASMPGNWLGGRLSSGRAILIFDGLDELSDGSRKSALIWLEKLAKEYPNAHLIVTSRPEGLPLRWFTERKFISLELQPMDNIEIAQCAAAWFRALNKSCPPDRVPDYQERERMLVGEMEAGGPVRDLAETPLLCAMLCALYAYNLSATAPQTRADLYESVVEVLADARGRARGVEKDSDGQFSRRQKISLLRAIARHMVESSKVSIPLLPDRRDSADPLSRAGERTALELIEERLILMPTLQIPARDALDYLVTRSTVFHSVTNNEGQFAHRSLQEYLAGCEIATTHGLPLLAGKIVRPEWRKIIAFASARAPMDEGSKLTSSILDEAEASPTQWRELILLAAECISAVEVQPEVSARAKVAISKLLPPRTTEEAVSAVSGFSEGILPWLVETDAESWSQSTIRACIHAVGLIRGRNALALMSQYSMRYVGHVPDRAFLDEWAKFDVIEYARRVLANLPLAETFTIKNSVQLQAATDIRKFQKLRFDISDSAVSFNDVAAVGCAEDIDIQSSSGIRTLRGIENLPNLRRLHIADASALEDVKGIERAAQLEELYLSRCTQLRDPSPIAGLNGLKLLHFKNALGVEDFDWLRPLTKLKTLSLQGCRVANTNFFDDMRELRTLTLDLDRRNAKTIDLTEFQFLRRVVFRVGPMLDSADWHLAGPALKSLSITGRVRRAEFEAAAVCETLHELTLETLLGVESVECLAGLTELRTLRLIDCEDLAEASALAGLRNVSRLEITGAKITNLGFLNGMQNLTHVTLDACREINDVTPLANLPRLEYVSLGEGLSRVDPDVIERIAEQVGFSFFHDPFSYEGINPD